MSKDDDEHPTLTYYRKMKSAPLTREQAKQASFDERFNSIAHWLVRQVNDFWWSLSREGQVTYSIDDVFTEIWVELREKNEYFDAEVASYLTYANRLVRHHLLDLRERSRCVRLPQNSLCNLKSQVEAYDSKTLTKSQGMLLLQLMAANRDHFRLGNADRELVLQRPDGLPHEKEPTDARPTPQEAIESEEEECERWARLSERLVTLTATECVVLGATLGLWGQTKSAVGQVALQYGRSDKFIRQVLKSARSKLGIKLK